MQQDKKYMNESENRLLIRQNIIFRAFLINLILIVVVWACRFSTDVMEFWAGLIQLSVTELDNYPVNCRGGIIFGSCHCRILGQIRIEKNGCIKEKPASRFFYRLF
ncbi:MAG: hypothetical protein LBF37_02920 [Rickettsiales bacterium]|jgi:hypothetical protein|nr:hypothetical protein [Rickettsiales bacterium]